MQSIPSNSSSSATYMSPRAAAFSVLNLINADTHVVKQESSLHNSASNNQEKFLLKPEIPPIVASAELLCRDLWLEFHALGTEMIITKAGRRMFPSIKIRLTGLADDTSYLIYVQMELVDKKRYRYIYQSSKWVPGGPGDVPVQEQRYFHPDGIQSGRYWMTQNCISFDKLKLTNSRAPTQRDLIPLHSMHRYQPKIYVVRVPEEWKSSNSLKMNGTIRESLPEFKDSVCFTFPETTFITVTAYQNQQITKLKIASNPFAKGFREPSREPRDSDPNYVSREHLPKRPRLEEHHNNTRSTELAPLWELHHQQSQIDPTYLWWIHQFSVFQPFFTLCNSHNA